ncbi:MAG: hypothetical protein BGO54_04315 [Sphingobacteriales bacterium 46-32]|nr:MAG: hypothetical protein BGO54_04315 [Sphingobacteriales bacterium 46-32]
MTRSFAVLLSAHDLQKVVEKTAKNTPKNGPLTHTLTRSLTHSFGSAFLLNCPFSFLASKQFSKVSFIRFSPPFPTLTSPLLSPLCKVAVFITRAYTLKLYFLTSKSVSL